MASIFLIVLLFLRLCNYANLVKGTKLPALAMNNKPLELQAFASAPQHNDIYYLHESVGLNKNFMRAKRDTYRNDKGFIRFGRNSERNDNLENMFERQAKADRGFIRLGRNEGSRNNNGFIRFGRSGKDSFVRFGRNDEGMRFGRRGDKFIRFGRSAAAAKRSPGMSNDMDNIAPKSMTENFALNDNEYIVKFVKPIARYGRPDKFIRFGRRDQGFIRFGKRGNSVNNTDSDDSNELSSSNDISGNVVTPQYFDDSADGLLDASMLEFYLRPQLNDGDRINLENSEGKLSDDTSKNISL